jgi:sporulation protein YabP
MAEGVEMEEKRGTTAWKEGAGGAKNQRSHKLTLFMRRSCQLTGITDVISFDEQEVVLDTEMGSMILTGEQLHVTGLSLETGEVSLEGRVDGIRYMEGSVKKTGESLWKRLWK